MERSQAGIKRELTAIRSAEIDHPQHEAIRHLLDDVGRAEGAQGIQAIAETGYRGDVPAELLALFRGNEAHARGHIRAAAYDIYAAPDFDRT